MLGTATREQLDALWDYGFNIGMAFQLVDDLLDFTGEEVVLGKPVGGDLREGKMTLPVIHLLARGDARGDALIRKIVTTQDATLEEWRELRGLLVGSHAIDYAYRKAGAFVDEAKKALCAFPPSAERDALMFLPDYVVSRDR
jgi:octaprenyl-diphosphate synthase